MAIIYADGVHDDGPGLLALMSGEEVQFAYPEMAKKIGWVNGLLDLGGCTFRVEPQPDDNEGSIYHGAAWR